MDEAHGEQFGAGHGSTRRVRGGYMTTVAWLPVSELNIVRTLGSRSTDF